MSKYNNLPEVRAYFKTLRDYEKGVATDLDVTLARNDSIAAYDKAKAAEAPTADDFADLDAVHYGSM
ncbi:MAG TPA: hypothetical protein VHK27_05500 [Gammaproteobacteria bacterium]|nr:hypothetical protein [Gammaproteobacteria bacterium]